MRAFASLLMAVALLTLPAPGRAADKVSDGVVKIGVLTDMTGFYSDLAGAGLGAGGARWRWPTSAARCWASPSRWSPPTTRTRPTSPPTPPASGSTRSRSTSSSTWSTAATALAVMPVAAEKKRITLLSGPATTAITGEKCTAYNVHYTYNNWALANGTGREVVKHGGDSWFFITADYVFGKSLEEDTAKVVKAVGRQGAGLGPPPARAPPTSPATCSRPRPRAPRSSAWPTPAPTPSTPSSRPRSSASPRSRPWPACWSSSPTSTASGSRSPRACT